LQKFELVCPKLVEGDDGEVYPEPETSLYGVSAPAFHPNIIPIDDRCSITIHEIPKFRDFIPVRFVDKGSFGAVSFSSKSN
jgi:hypothetical protein